TFFSSPPPPPPRSPPFPYTTLFRSSNPPLRSSSGPPSPCITPSTVTIVRVVSFMVAAPFSLSLSSDSTGPRRRSHPSQRSPFGRLFRTLPEHGPHVGDVV